MRLPSSLRLAAFTAVLALVALVAGCSTLPTEPSVAPPSSARGAAPGSLLLADGGSDASATPSAGVTTSQRFSAVLGGSMTLDRFTLVVPPLALRQDAVITMHLPDPNGPECDLSISPPSANGFLVPVLLIGSYAGVPGLTDPLQLGMGWFDPALQAWVPVPGVQVNLVQQVVVAPLPHFSQYEIIYKGRAGW